MTSVPKFGSNTSALDALRYIPIPDFCGSLDTTGTTTTTSTLMPKYTWIDIGEDEMKDLKHKWEFNALHENLIDFELVASELSGENPIAFLEYGSTERYVIISDWLITKLKVLGVVESPEVYESCYGYEEDYQVYKIKGHFGEWVKWAKNIKAASWPENSRKHNVVEVSLPKI